MAETTTTEHEPQAAPAPPKQPAPIDVNPRGNAPGRLMAQLPKPVAYPAGGDPLIMGKLADKFAAAGPNGQAIHDAGLQALERTKADFEAILETEGAVSTEQANLQKSGHSPVQLLRKDGQIFAVGQRFVELADTANPILAKRQDAFDASIRRVATLQENIQKKLDESVICAETGRDANLRQDVRSWLVSLGKKAPTAAIEAARDGDMQVIHTVLTSSPRVLGLTQKDVEQVRDIAQRLRAPEDHAANEATNELLERIRMVSRRIGQKQASLQGYRSVDKALADDALKKLRKKAKT